MFIIINITNMLNTNNQYTNMNNNQFMPMDYMITSLIVTLLTQSVSEIVRKMFELVNLIITYFLNKYKNYFCKTNTLKINITENVPVGSFENASTIMSITQYGYAILHYIETHPNVNLESLEYNKKKFLPISIMSYYSQKESNDSQYAIRTNGKDRENSKKDYKQSNDILLEENIYINFSENETKDFYRSFKNYTAILKTSKHISLLTNFIERINNEYIEYKKLHQDFNNKILTVLNVTSTGVHCLESVYDTSNNFDNLFFDKKEFILDQLKILHADNTIKKFKKKMSLMLHGSSGSGKSAIVQAIASKLNRCIIYIPSSKIDMSQEHMFNVMYGNKYNDHIIENHEKIIFFDEIDAITINKIKNMKKVDSHLEEDVDDLEKIAGKQTLPTFNLNISDKNNNDGGKNVSMNTDKNNEFDLGFLLTLLDGPFDQDNMIFIATANNLKSIDKAFYRNGRFTSFETSYMDNINIANMISYYYDVKLTDEQINKIRNDKNISNSHIKNTCVTSYINKKTIDSLIDEINSIEKIEN